MRTSSRRAVFLDVDGTYAHHGVAPKAHIDVVRAARAQGHAVLLCTGRPVSMLPDHLLEPGFDGIVAGAGAHVTVGETVLADVRFPEALARRTLRLLDDAGSLYLVEAPEATYTTPSAYEALAARAASASASHLTHLAGLRDIVAILEPRKDLTDVGITKITSFYAERPMAAIAQELGEAVGMFPSSIADMGSGAGELFLSHISKATGLEVALPALGVSREDAVAMGDNLNDLEMLAYAGTAVAMADGSPEAIALADLVVPGPAHEGLVEAFETLGLVGW